MKKQLATTTVLALLVLGMTFSGAAQTLEQGSQINSSDNDNTTSEGSSIDVGIASTTAIDVKPNSLNFPSLEVGGQVTEETTGDNIFGSFTLENIGSEYIDRVWVEATDMSNDPFGTGNPNNYNAANFLQVKPNNATPSGINGDDQVYHYVNRHEFSASWSNSTNQIPSYIRASPSESLSGDTAADTYVGRIRAGDEWYFYTVVTGSSNDVCDGSQNAELRIGNSVHSSSSFGTVDFTSDNSGDYSTYQLEPTNGEYGLTQSAVSLDFEVDGSTVTRTYDLLTRCEMGTSGEDPHLIRTRYNVRAGDVPDITAAAADSGDSAGSQTQFLLSTATADDMLLPGEQFIVDTAIEVPQGVPQGSVQTGDLTFHVTSDYDVTNY
jgi:hypothetical protein